MTESNNNKEFIKFCQAPSNAYLEFYENCDQDPRLVAGRYALNKAGSLAQRGWQANWEDRCSTTNRKKGLKKQENNNVFFV